MPLYNFYTFWIRFAGIINSINSSGTWRTKNYTEEYNDSTELVKKDFSFITNLVTKIKVGISKTKK